jgi:hypothetical protein
MFLFILIALLNIIAQNVHAQENNKSEPEDFYIMAVTEAALYKYESVSLGGGIAIGYGSGSSLGLRIIFYPDNEEIQELEINIKLRLYLLGARAYQGPFLQLMAGPVLFNRPGDYSIPAFSGSLSAGVSFGWRFIFNDRWFMEPAVRGGYPYIFGGGLNAGVRF